MNKNLLSGLGNHFSSEALAGSLPLNQNSPQKPDFGLYAEQLNGSAFTAPRDHNLYVWLYKLRPSVVHKKFTPLKELTQKTFFKYDQSNPNQMRWNARTYSSEKSENFIESFRTVMGNGGPEAQAGLAVHLYAATQDMTKQFFMNADGDFLIVPQEGRLKIKTELGILEIEPEQIAVIPRGMKFQIQLPDQKSKGYVAENFGAPFKLPELGPIGANGLANPRHFFSPHAAYEDKEGDFELIGKFNQELWSCELTHSPLDVVAWHGNYAPYMYDLRKFNTINTVSFDHPDPSIFTVLTSPSNTPGVANIDFVIFPPRWMTAENTFRPPYFHRNIMSECMGLIHGNYDAKEAGGFMPGGMSLHNAFSAHGPDAETFQKASHVELKPHKIDRTMAFMFETRLPYKITSYALSPELLQNNYQDCWQNLKKNFSPS